MSSYTLSWSFFSKLITLPIYLWSKEFLFFSSTVSCHFQLKIKIIRKTGKAVCELAIPSCSHFTMNRYTSVSVALHRLSRLVWLSCSTISFHPPNFSSPSKTQAQLQHPARASQGVGVQQCLWLEKGQMDVLSLGMTACCNCPVKQLCIYKLHT